MGIDAPSPSPSLRSTLSIREQGAFLHAIAPKRCSPSLPRLRCGQEVKRQPMTKQEINDYVEGLKNRISLDRYVERRFTAADASGGLPADFDYRFHGSFRNLEPRLAELLTHPRVMVLAEPGGGKSITAYAALLEILSKGERIPVLAELKGYRSDLSLLMHQSVPAELLKVAAFVDGAPVHRTYVLDGVDEVPAELVQQFAADLSSLLKSDPNAQFFVTARQAFYVASRSLFSDIPAVFHILELTDEDIRQYVRQSQLEVSDFMEALRAADATEEVRNPFGLSVNTWPLKRSKTNAWIASKNWHFSTRGDRMTAG